MGSRYRVFIILVSIICVCCDRYDGVLNKRKNIEHDNTTNYVSDAPIDPKEKQMRSFGSIRDAIIKVIDKKVSDIEKVNVKGSNRDKIFENASKVLCKYPIELIDRKNCIIKTSDFKSKKFDSTGTCIYRLSIEITDNCDIVVNVASTQDSKSRLDNIGMNIRKEILSEN